jgi:hypothetical protein
MFSIYICYLSINLITIWIWIRNLLHNILWHVRNHNQGFPGFIFHCRWLPVYYTITLCSGDSRLCTRYFLRKWFLSVLNPSRKYLGFCLNKGISLSYPLSPLVTNYLQGAESLITNCHSAIQEIPLPLMEPESHYRVHKKPPLAPDLSRMDPDITHTPSFYLCSE